MANILHVERAANKITLGTTGTTINIASHTASQSLALDASKNLESVDLSNVYQPLDAELTSLAALSYVEASFVKMTGANTFALRTLGQTADDLEGTIDHDNLANFAANEHYLQSAITEVGTIGTGIWQGSSIAVGYTDAKCTDATADNTAGNETSHATVLVDADFGSAGLMYTDGAGGYSLKAIGTDVQAYHENLAAVAGATWIGASSITTLGTIGTGTWGATDVAILHGGTGASTAQAAIDALTAVSGATNEHVLTKDTGTGNATWKVATGGGTDEKVKVDVGATADYIGAANSDGVLRTTTGLSYVDGGNFVTLGLSHLGFESLTSPTPNDRIPFWDNSASAFAWLSPSTGLGISTTSLGLNFGALGEETTPDVLDVVCIYDPTGGAHHKVTLANLKAFGAYTNEDDSSAVLLKDHAYLANQDGIVTVDAESGGAGHYIRGYIGATNDPAGAGDRITAYQDFGGTGYDMGISFPVAKGKYFEITANATITNIWWQPIGALIKPTDQD